MGVRNQHWYSVNEGSAYPLSDAATAINDDGQRLPSNIIVDLHLRWPASLGQYALLSSVSVSPGLVSLTIQVSDSLDDSSDFTPIAAIGVARPLAAGRQIALQALAPGVGGWVVFGAGASPGASSYRGRFSSPQQGLLLQRIAQPYRDPPVTALRAFNALQGLTGIVNLEAEAPLELVSEQREIDGVLRTCAVLRLVQPSAQSLEDNIFNRFAGPCGSRPESDTCGDPTPIEFINSVAPDCNGFIHLQFLNCAVVAKHIDGHGLVVDCGLGLIDACLPAQLPGSDGRLPGDEDPDEPPDPPDPPEEEPSSDSTSSIGTAGYNDCFEDGTADDFEDQLGTWEIINDGSPDDPCTYSDSSASSDSDSSEDPEEEVTLHSYEVTTTATRNATIYETEDETTFYRRVTTDVKMLAGPTGAKQNAHLILNYRPHPTISGFFVYYLVEIDFDAQTFGVGRFNGTSFINVLTTLIPSITLNTWYRLSATIVPGPLDTQAQITATLNTVTTESLDVTLGPVTVTNYQEDQGVFGFGSNRALARFSYIDIQEAS